MRINNKGFSLVELLATVTIMGILMGIGIAAYTRYQDSARKRAYDTMAQSAANAAEQYQMTFVNTSTVTFETLVANSLLSDTKDPTNQSNICKGKVVLTRSDADDTKLATTDYTVYECCGAHNYKYFFPKGGTTYTIKEEVAPSTCN